MSTAPNPAGATVIAEIGRRWRRGSHRGRAKEQALSPDGHAIQAAGLTKYYGSLPVVDRVSLDVRRGEILGSLGPGKNSDSLSIDREDR